MLLASGLDSATSPTACRRRPPSSSARLPQSSRFTALLLLIWFALSPFFQRVACDTDAVEVLALQAIKRSSGDLFNRLSNWQGDDPCGTNWTGVICTPNNGTQHVTELRLLNMNLTGTLAPDLGNLTHLSTLDFMWNNITGPIPPEIGNLSNLTLLLLCGNKLSGELPPELSNLSNLDRLQVDENNLTGSIPPSFQFLNKARHFHMNNNSLTGTIPPELGNLESVIHILFDNNDLNGGLPTELSNISTLKILQLDNNRLSGPIPPSYSNLSSLVKLSLRNCGLNGTIPELSGLTQLAYLDLSENRLTGTLPENLSETVTTFDMAFNELDGELLSVFYGLTSLELLYLQNNSLNGTITAEKFQHSAFKEADSVLIMNFENNNFTAFTSGALLDLPNVTLQLAGNPVCNGSSALSKYCENFNNSISMPTNTASVPITCSCDTSRNQESNYKLLANGTCSCQYPLTVQYRLKSPSFAIYQPYEPTLEEYLANNTGLFSYQVNASDFYWEPGPRLRTNIKLFPNEDMTQFSGADVNRLYTQFATWQFPESDLFGPYELIAFVLEFPYASNTTAGSNSGLSGGDIAGIAIGAAVFTAIVVAAVMILIGRRRHQHVAARKRAAREHLKIDGVKDFTFLELKKATNNFDASTQIGRGGYGRVYKAVLLDGMVVAIKRAQEGSLQGEKEFLTELELLSRVHHRNLLSLVGYCDDEGEQLLVYEYMPNGTLRDLLNSDSKVSLSFATRLQIALGAARGILYLHTEANPPIFHRDIKATNILLDKMFIAKVADFGLSKLATVPEFEGDAGGFVSTVVKGTPGYLDPEYFLTRKLTDKSDVYSFGVVLLELISGRHPISNGKNIVREVNLAYEAGMILSIVDPRMGHYPAECLQPFLRLALLCCKDETDERPSMADVVRELEGIWRLMPMTDSMTSIEAPLEIEANNRRPKVGSMSSFASSNPFVSYDEGGSALVSGTMPSIAPR